MNFKDKLVKLDACDPAIEWVGDRTAGQAWNECRRAGWMLWYLDKTNNITQEQSVKIAVHIARSVLGLFENKHPDDTRPRQAIEAAEAWLKNPCKETANEAANAAAYEAENADYDAYAAAYAAANAAANAANYDANEAANEAANAANYAANAANYAAYAAENADFIRTIIKYEDLKHD